MVSFEQRLKKIKTTEEAEEQVRLSKGYVTRLRNEAKKCETLDGKLAMNEKVKQAESVLRKMRRSIFDIEDAINNGLAATSILN